MGATPPVSGQMPKSAHPRQWGRCPLNIVLRLCVVLSFFYDYKDNEDNSDICGMCMHDGVDIVRRVKSVKSDKSVFNTFPFSEIKNIGLL